MSLLNKHQIAELCCFAVISDQQARSDLFSGSVVSENDYSSNFTGGLRRIINSHSRTGLKATSQMLRPSTERALGCDGAILIRNGNNAKLALFEAKWPKFSKPGYRWDKLQKSSGVSHFTSQIVRQHRVSGTVAVFEMVQCEYEFNTQPSFMQSHGASCIWHKTAYQFSNSRALQGARWSQKELEDLLELESLNIAAIISDVCECKAGKLMHLQGELSEAFKELELAGEILVIEGSEMHGPE